MNITRISPLAFALLVSIVTHAQQHPTEPPSMPAEPPTESKSEPIAQEPSTEQEINQLKQQIQRLHREVKETRSQITSHKDNTGVKNKSTLGATTLQRFSSLGAGASKIYFHPTDLAFGVSADIFQYTDRRGPLAASDSHNTTNIAGLSPYIGYRFSDSLIFNSKFSFLSGGAESHTFTSSQSGSAIVEVAYLDFILHEQSKLGIRIGHQHLPIGWMNLLQDPIYHYSVSRPEVELFIIPSSWHENGFLVWSEQERIHFQAGVFNGLNWRGFSQDEFVRRGRQDGQEALTEDIAAIARIDIKSSHTTFGGSFYYGSAAQGHTAINHAALSLWEAHLKTRWHFVDFTALYTEGTLSDVDSINVELNRLSPGSDPIGRKARGYYMTLAIDLLGATGSGQTATLPLFVRYSEYNTQAQSAPGDAELDQLHKVRTTVGLNYRPLPNVALKADYQFRKNKATQEDDLFQLGASLVF